MQRLDSTIHLNNNSYTTSVVPMAIGLFFTPRNTNRYVGAGYLFDGYTRPILADGVRNENIFWDVCADCVLYKKSQCSGGYQVLQARAGTATLDILNEQNQSVRKRYSKEFCKVHYDTTFLRDQLAGSARINVNLLPHFFFLKAGVPYWFTFRAGSEGELEFLQYRLFNTYNSGEMCFGNTNNYRDNSIPSRYETFLSARINNDLNPTSWRGSGRTDVLDWVRSFTPETLISSSEISISWESAQNKFAGSDGKFLLLPALYDRVYFGSVNRREMPDFLVSHMTGPTNVVPFVRDSEGRWFCIYDLGTQITRENAPEIFGGLR